jgi:hypothetical protein
MNDKVSATDTLIPDFLKRIGKPVRSTIASEGYLAVPERRHDAILISRRAFHQFK